MVVVMPQNDQSMQALTFICGVLSPWLSEEDNSRLHDESLSDKIDWHGVAECANRNNLIPALCYALEKKGYTANVPSDFRDYLKTVYQFNFARNEALSRQIVDIVEQLNAVDVTPLLLKGGAALMTDLYPDPGVRFMWDLDILVPEEMLSRSVSALMSQGYQVPECYLNISYVGKEHTAPLCQSGRLAAVELHSSLFRKNMPLLSVEDLWPESRPCPSLHLSGLSARVMSPTDELIYCFAHSELKHNHHDKAVVDARQLHHFSALYCRHQNEIEWKRIAALAGNSDYGPACRAYLYLAELFFHVPLPVSYKKDQYAVKHYQKVLSSYCGWKKQKKLMKLLLANLVSSFSKEYLNAHYPDNNGNFNALRAKYLWALIGRFSRKEAWQAKFKNLVPF